MACWRLGRLAFRDPQAPWGGVALVASLLTIPVAGTSLYIMDQYLTTRSLSAPAVIFILVNALERKLGRAALWAIFAVLIHPLMAVFGLSYAVLVVGMSRTESAFAGARRQRALLAAVRLVSARDRCLPRGARNPIVFLPAALGVV